MARCPAGHELTSHDRRRPCASCRREQLIRYVIRPRDHCPPRVAAAVDAVVTSPAVLRELAAAAAAGPGMLRHGEPRLPGAASELIARGSATLAPPRCARAAGTGPGSARPAGACARRAPPARTPPSAPLRRGQGGRRPRRAGQRICERCRPRDRGHRQCGRCGETADRGARPRRRAGHLRQLLPDAQRRLQRLRHLPETQLRRQRPSGLPVMHAAGRGLLRPLRPGPPGPGPLARRAGLRSVLHRRAAAPGTMRILRAAAAARVPARPGRHDLRHLRRISRDLRMHQLRHRRQALPARHVRPVQLAAPRHGTAHRARRGHPGRAGARARGDLRRPQPEIRAQLARQKRSRRAPRPGHLGDPAGYPRGT